MDDAPPQSSSRSSALLKSLLLLLILCAVIAVSLELAGRWAVSHKKQNFLVSPHLNWTGWHAYHPELMWVLKPNLKEVDQGFPFNGRNVVWKVSTNELGLRQGPVGPKTNRYRVLCLGDSRTYGMGVNNAETWPSQLQAEMDRGQPGQYEIINAAVTGYTANQGLRYLRNYGLKLKPDLLLVCFAYNEGAPIPPPGIGDCDWENPEASGGFIALLKDAIRGAGLQRPSIIEKKDRRLTPGELLDTLIAFAEVAQQNHIALAYLACPSFPELSGIPFDRPFYTGLVGEAAAYTRTPAIDLTDTLLNAGQEIFVDDVHLNAAGCRLVAARVAKELPAIKNNPQDTSSRKPLKGPPSQPDTIEQCSRLLDLNPSFEPVLGRLEDLLRTQNNPAARVTKWQAVAAAHQDVGRIYWHLAQALKAAGNQQELTAALRKASELAPCDISMQMDLATALAEQNDTEGAALALAAVVNMYPSPAVWPQITEAMKAIKAKGGTWANVDANIKRDRSLPNALIDELKKI